MKKHAIIPIFISHRGCPNDCVFCNQKRITSRLGDVTPEGAKNTIDTWLTTLGNVDTVEVSFYGGSFTGLPTDEQNSFLEIAKSYKDSGKISAIHLSTRPDYISAEILDNLKRYTVDCIELGVQSFSDDVLRLSGRGHNSSSVYAACEMIKKYDISLGIQLMTGLPGDTLETCIFSARETVGIAPDIARIYPTVVLKDTRLYDMLQRGDYKPLSLEDSVLRAKAVYEILDDAGINIIRVGLKSSEIMSDEIGFHPAFRQLVESEIAREKIESIIVSVYGNDFPRTIYIYANSHSFGNIYGHKAMNISYFSKKYPNLKIKGRVDNSLRDNRYLSR